jgi:hypothetical protein
VETILAVWVIFETTAAFKFHWYPPYEYSLPDKKYNRQNQGNENNQFNEHKDDISEVKVLVHKTTVLIAKPFYNKARWHCTPEHRQQKNYIAVSFIKNNEKLMLFIWRNPKLSLSALTHRTQQTLSATLQIRFIPDLSASKLLSQYPLHNKHCRLYPSWSS